MGRYTFPAFNQAPTPRYVVLWDLHWHVLDCQRLAASADLSGAMAAAIERRAGEGWQAEATPEYGFVFIRRETDRRLLMLTPRDPYDSTRQSFSPFA
jgi:predicted dehydrogenase